MLDEIFEDDMGDLNSLLSDSIDYKKSQALKKAKFDKGVKHFQTKATQETVKKIQKAEVKVDWKPIAAIAMFYEQVCLHCGTRHRHFQGYFQHQQHKWQQHSFKYVPASDHTMTDGLPHFTKVVESSSDVCAACINNAEWPDENLYLTEHETPHIATWTAHKVRANLPGSNNNGWFEPNE